MTDEPPQEHDVLQRVRAVLRQRLAHALEVSVQNGREDAYALGRFVEARDAMREVEEVIS